MIFETERLYTRRFTEGDLKLLHEMQGNPNVMRYITGRARTLEQDMAELDRIIRSYDSLNSDSLIMAVAEKSVHQFIGACAVIKNERNEHEVGYRLLEKHWGKGYGKEILPGLVYYCMNILGLDVIAACVDGENTSSIRILEASGFMLVSECENEGSGKKERYYKFTRV